MKHVLSTGICLADFLLAHDEVLGSVILQSMLKTDKDMVLGECGWGAPLAMQTWVQDSKAVGGTSEVDPSAAQISPSLFGAILISFLELLICSLYHACPSERETLCVCLCVCEPLGIPAEPVLTALRAKPHTQPSHTHTHTKEWMQWADNSAGGSSSGRRQPAKQQTILLCS